MQHACVAAVVLDVALLVILHVDDSLEELALLDVVHAGLQGQWIALCHSAVAA